MSSEENQIEQQNEIEALQAIYPDEFTLVSVDSPLSFEVLVLPTTASNAKDNHVLCRLLCELPPNYPSTQQPIINVRNEKGLTSQQIQEIQGEVAQVLSSSSGQVCIYSVVECVQCWLVDHNVPQLSMHAAMEERVKQAAHAKQEEAKKIQRVEEEKKRLEPSPLGIEPGTLLTAESFAHWRRLFEAEQRALAEAAAALKPKLTALTGKQIFQQNLAIELTEEEEEKLTEEPARQDQGTLLYMDKGLFMEEGVQVDEQGDDDEDDEDEEWHEGDFEDDDDDDEDDDMTELFDTDAARSSAASKPSSSSQPAPASSSSSSSSTKSSTHSQPAPQAKAAANKQQTSKQQPQANKKDQPQRKK